MGRSKPMRQLHQLIKSVAPTDANVLITGENGTGKEVVAQRHPRKQQARQGPVHQSQLRGHPQPS